MTSPAITNPATAGTKALLPGISRRSVQCRFVPGGQMQWVRQLIAISSMGFRGGFLGIDDFQMIDSPFPKLSPHNPRQRINPGLRDIRHTKRRWVQFVSRTHAADDRCTSLSTFFRQCQLCRNRIHGIHHIVIIFKRKGIGILRQKKAGVYPHIS